VVPSLLKRLYGLALVPARHRVRIERNLHVG
jgi:hypothetical protein